MPALVWAQIVTLEKRRRKHSCSAVSRFGQFQQGLKGPGAVGGSQGKVATVPSSPGPASIKLPLGSGGEAKTAGWLVCLGLGSLSSQGKE